MTAEDTKTTEIKELEETIEELETKEETLEQLAEEKEQIEFELLTQIKTEGVIKLAY